MATEVKNSLSGPPPMSPKVEAKAKKPGPRARHQGDSGPQKELVVPGIVDFELAQEAVRTPKPQTPGAYRFGRLSHHSFFSRHHPHPQHVTHIQDLTGKPVCVVQDKFSLAPLPPAMFLPSCLIGMSTISIPIGDPQSNRDPQLSSETWKRALKDLASRVAIFTKENEAKRTEQKAELKREQGAKYSTETGRLIPASTPALSQHSSRQSQRSSSSGRAGGVQTSVLQDPELLILELLCQILQTDSLSAIQFWLLFAPPQEKDLALGLLQAAVAHLLPQPLVSIPTEKLLNQLQDVQKSTPEKEQPHYSQSPKLTKTSPVLKSEKPEYVGTAQVLRVNSSRNSEEKALASQAES
ncbi:protein TBATA [Tenrec ecaudatus]|uniref:protein TBATA n=1 Tax=Tenrec ecaudatus TaxID=94439 RepID=UPI003F5A8148